MTANTIMSIAHFPVTAVIANSSLKNSIQNNQPDDHRCDQDRMRCCHRFLLYDKGRADNCDQDRARRGNALFFHSELPAENHQTAHHDKICNPSRKRLDQDIGKKMPMDLIPVLLQRQKK